MKGLSPRREAFCQAFVQIPVAARAAVAAGYSPASARNQGYRLLQSAAVLARIRELRERMAWAHAERRADLLAKLESVYRRAMEDHQYAAAGRAVGLQAALGLGSEEKMTTVDDGMTTSDDIRTMGRRRWSAGKNLRQSTACVPRIGTMTTNDDGRRHPCPLPVLDRAGESGCKDRPEAVRLAATGIEDVS